MKRTIVIIGAGHAGVQAAGSLRDEGFDGVIRLIDAQTAQPYQRPPLSKAFLKGEANAQSIILRGEAFYGEKAIDLALGETVASLDRHSRKLHLGSGRRLGYDHLILATGARARTLPVPGADLKGVHVLRDLGDASRIREALATSRSIVVIGAGFIGLEFAAVAASLGAGVTVIETRERVMARAVSPAIAQAVEARHIALGVRLLLNAGVARLQGVAGHVTHVELASGARIAADLVIVGIGVQAKDRLAAESGLTLENGIRVDQHLVTSDATISAIGDNASHPNPFFNGMVRLESVQNAVDQAKCVARNILGRSEAYRAIPWFWSDQADLKLQIAGIASVITRHVTRGDPESGAFSVFGYAGDRLAVVESINKPADHMLARRLIDAGISPSADDAADPSFDLKRLALRPSL